MSAKLELSEHGRFLFETRDGSRSSGVVVELSETSVRIKWDASGNAVWYSLRAFSSVAFGQPEYEIIEKLKPLDPSTHN